MGRLLACHHVPVHIHALCSRASEKANQLISYSNILPLDFKEIRIKQGEGLSSKLQRKESAFLKYFANIEKQGLPPAPPGALSILGHLQITQLMPRLVWSTFYLLFYWPVRIMGKDIPILKVMFPDLYPVSSEAPQNWFAACAL